MTDKKKKQIPEERVDRNYGRACAFFRPLFRLFFPFRQVNLENIPNSAVLICPNHFSDLDPLTVCFALPKQSSLRVMAKQELLDAPILGRFMRRWGIFGVKRGNSDVGAIKTALRHLKAGRKLLLFPEGTRVKEGEDSTGKTGAIMLALRTGTPILPCYCEKRKHLFQRTAVVFGEPYMVEIEGKKASPKEYKERAEELIQRIYALKEQVK